MPDITNMQRLIARKVARDAVPPGKGIRSAIGFLRDIKRLSRDMSFARSWARSAVSAVRNAREPNPWRNATDEEIAGEILRRIDERTQSERRP